MNLPKREHLQMYHFYLGLGADDLSELKYKSCNGLYLFTGNVETAGCGILFVLLNCRQKILGVRTKVS